MSKYGQYCPLALAAEVLCERWNLLILRRIIDGCRRFNDIHQGVPKISATLLSRRLQALEHAGLIQIKPATEGRGHRYLPLPACMELEPISNTCILHFPQGKTIVHSLRDAASSQTWQ